MAETKKMSLKLLVNKRNQTVLFAEAGKDFVDFLSHCLALPLGTIVSLLPKEGAAGGLLNLHASVENLSDTSVGRRENESLLNPKARSSRPDVVRLLFPEAPSLAPIDYYTCPRTAGGCISYSNLSGASCDSCVTDSPSTRCPGCNNMMSKKLSWVAGPAGGAASLGGYAMGVVTYMVMDDLVVKPMSAISCIALLNSFNVHDIGDLQEKVIDFGLDEAIKLLSASLHSKTVLTDIFSEVLTD
ncbi:uncharacterized protein LOC115756742 isoform X1 [Rhodamnia argentea]|uniref:Uncharacterized protein LOC115756742 isoform X1 n=1 Tax=Rhodamnia argentea TaxID=178133 RepID=A0ABM3HS00_9MYRT|nr:uncharacterized protein LOC115756742 isoform X1 [Rhodamnia argentea]